MSYKTHRSTAGRAYAAANKKYGKAKAEAKAATSVTARKAAEKKMAEHKATMSDLTALHGRKGLSETYKGAGKDWLKARGLTIGAHKERLAGGAYKYKHGPAAVAARKKAERAAAKAAARSKPAPRGRGVKATPLAKSKPAPRGKAAPAKAAKKSKPAPRGKKR